MVSLSVVLWLPSSVCFRIRYAFKRHPVRGYRPDHGVNRGLYLRQETMRYVGQMSLPASTPHVH